MSQWVHTGLTERHAITEFCHRITTALLDGLSKFREGEEKRTAQSVFSQVSMRPVWSEPTVFYHRFEKAIASLNPTEHKPDPVTYFWTVYKKVADEYDNDLLSKYVGDLDTSLLFVSAFMSLHTPFTSTYPSVLGGFILGRHFRVYRPNHPTTPAKSR